MSGGKNIVRAMAARDMVLRMVANYPGLYDGESEVNGADLVEWVSNEIHAMLPDDDLTSRACEGSPVDDDEDLSGWDGLSVDASEDGEGG